MNTIEDEDSVQLGSSISLVDMLRSDLNELEETTDVLIPIEGYDSVRLSIKYFLPKSGKDLDNIACKVMREIPKSDEYTRNFLIGMDTMIFLCRGLYAQPGDATEPLPFDPNNTGEAVKFDVELASLIGLSPDESSARAVVRKLFGGQELKILAHGEKLARWIRNTKVELDTEFWESGKT